MGDLMELNHKLELCIWLHTVVLLLQFDGQKLAICLCARNVLHVRCYTVKLRLYYVIQLS